MSRDYLQKFQVHVKMLAARPLIHVLNLQRMGFMSAYDVQMRYARHHLDEMSGKPGARGYNMMLLVEHNPVYTVGIRDHRYSAEEARKLKSLGAEFIRTNRGGLITFHGPGQLVAYPILNLKHFGIGMRDYVCRLEKTMIQTCAAFGVKATTTSDTGVWVEDRKIGALGLHGSRYITTHGVSLNCNVDLSWFDHILPCGLEGKDVTSLSEEVERDITVTETEPFFLKAFQDNFSCEIDKSFLTQDQYCILPTVENLERSVKKHKTDRAR